MTKKKKNKVTNSARFGKNKSKDPLSSRERVFQKEILAFMKTNRSKSFTSKQVISGTGLFTEVGINKVRSILDRLTDKGKLQYLEKGKYQYNAQEKFVIGELDVTKSGGGFILQEETDDIYISPGELGKAFHGDIVKAKLVGRRKKSGRKEGVVVEVLQRKQNKFIGIVEEGLPGTFFFLPDSRKIPQDFYLPKEHLNGAQNGQKVLVELMSWKGKSPEAKVIEVLGEAGEHNTEMHAILLQYGFDPRFPEAVEAEASKISEKIPEAEIQQRRDMRSIQTFTIDPVDAKDFDDALSFQQLDNGNYEVGVHIADVSYYVRPDTEIDKEGFHRATSVYLVDRTVPMLPEKLSNNLCSLRPELDRLAFAAIFEMNDEAKVLNQWIGRTVIHSDKRFTYKEAQEAIDEQIESPHKDALQKLNQLALKLREKRMAKGSIDFDSDEVKFELDDNDKPVRVIRKERLNTHKMIEDFMLLANRKVAAYIHGLFSNPPLPFIYRIHDHPNPDKLSGLQEFVGHFGHKVNLENTENTSLKLNTLLKKVAGSPEQNVIETLAVRSMAKAEYSTKNIGHFGLGFQYYTHFTSPIRRYPDLMVHRLLHQYGQKQFKQDQKVLDAQAKHCSNRERTAAEAERESIKYKQVEFLEDKIGESFEGIISGVIEQGLFIQLDQNLCEGFVHIRSLEDDYYVYDTDNYALVGHTHHRVLRLGDPVKVEISGTDLKRRTIDMLLKDKLPVKAAEKQS